ncbi:ElaA protein [Croceivirga lutea]|uniref:GNAT family N-acetyltransferase n=1 Tax=Croceivirga lutea TaxID=1775167 RepID=UPI00163B5B9E|nr:GNAT family N-acetyltransferase [Croceivirga lutea]GGG38740.1 ElaA protein [Croceivirga lutea]
MNILIKTFTELTKEELYALLQLRSEVFVVEQDCVYQDIDGKDNQALHVLGYENKILVAYLRIFGPEIYFENPSLGRVVVKKNHRKKAFGQLLLLKSLEKMDSLYADKNIEISAQTYLKKFYEDFNFKQVGEGYLEDGIPHIKMLRAPKS